MIIARFIFWTHLLGALITFPTHAGDAGEVELACRQQMRIIHEALTYYIEANDKMPDELGDLVGDYIQPGVLHCPATKDSGEINVDDKILIAPSNVDGRVWGYKYEFSIRGGEQFYHDTAHRRFNWLEYKYKQLSSIGGKRVPCVRCDKHGDALKSKGHSHLNLTFNGKVYSGPIYWEEMHVNKVPYVYLTPDLIDFSQKPLEQYMVNRSIKATPQMVNLRPYCNAMLEHPWIFGYWKQELDKFVATYPDGIFENGEIGFDVPGLIQLGGILTDDYEKGYKSRYYPDSKLDILMDARFSKLHVLGGVLFPSESGEEVAYLDLVSEDGAVIETISWIYGKDVVCIFADEEDAPLVTPKYRVLWREEVTIRKKKEEVKLFHMQFTNPVPNAHISKIHFRAGENVASPFIAGLTWEP